MRTRLPISFAAAITALALQAPTATAAISKTAITTPSADPTYLVNRDGTSLKISGTAVSTSPATDQVDIWCSHDDGDANPRNPEPLVQNVPLSANGHFSVVIGLPQYLSGACRLRALPTNTFPQTGLSAFSGPRLVTSSIKVTTQSGIDGEQTAYDFTIDGAQLGGEMQLQSAGDWGLSATAPYDTTVLGSASTSEFYGAGWFMNPSDLNNGSSSQNSSIQVDGKNAYTPYSAEQINSTAGGRPSLAVSLHQNPSTGALTISDTEPLVTCPGVTWAGQGGATCNTFAPSGVELDRKMLLGGNGRIVTIDDRFVSTDGSPHQLAVQYRNRQNFSDTSSTQQSSPIGYEFPGQTTFSEHNPGDAVGLPSGAPASVVIRNLTWPADDPRSGTGSLTWSRTPSNIHFLNIDAASFATDYSFTVPASKPYDLQQVYASEITAAAISQDDLAIDDTLSPPRVTISAPVRGSAFSSSRVTVKGVASAGSAVKSVAVDGVAAKLSTRGAYYVRVPLKPGKNIITAVVQSRAGNTAHASVTVTRS